MKNNFGHQIHFMENILLVLNGSKTDTNTVDFACYIANLTHSKLTGLFIENIVGEERPVLKQLYALPYVETITVDDLPENKEKIKSCETNEKLFADACINRGVNYHIHTNRKASVKEIIHESRFADLVIVNATTSFGNKIEAVPSHFVKEILGESECPVVIAPYSFNEIDEILFPYDGSKSSVYSIKQFAHLFPELKDKKITVLHVDKNDMPPVGDSEKIEQYLKSHYTKIEFKHLQGKADDQLFGYLLEKENIFVVMGSFGRRFLSTLFRKSTADLLVKTVNLPVFIAHNE
jgi:hypothetical protein